MWIWYIKLYIVVAHILDDKILQTLRIACTGSIKDSIGRYFHPGLHYYYLEIKVKERTQYIQTGRGNMYKK